MAKYVIKRVAMGIFSMFIVATLTFFIMNLVPGGPFVAEKSISAAAQQALEEKYGLDKPLGEALLAPTKIYVKPVLALMEQVNVKGVSHITGGGFYENIPRSLKAGCCARIAKADVRTPALFDLLAKEGGDRKSVV